MSKPPDFWSRRKAAVAEAEAAEAKARAEAEIAEREARLEEKTDEEILQELGLKDPEELQAGDDFAAFLKAAVPDRIRRRALRKLWLSNPALANLDNLVEYGEDYTDAATVVENLQSAIRLGRGALEQVEAQGAPPEGHEGPAAAGEQETVRFPSETEGDREHATMASATQPDEDPASGYGSDAGEVPATDQQAEAEEEEEAPRPRRMKFHFLD